MYYNDVPYCFEGYELTPNMLYRLKVLNFLFKDQWKWVQ